MEESKNMNEKIVALLRWVNHISLFAQAMLVMKPIPIVGFSRVMTKIPAAKLGIKYLKMQIGPAFNKQALEQISVLKPISENH